MTSRRVPRLQLLGAAALFSTGGAAIKATSLSAWEVAGYRSLVAALAFWLIVPTARRRWSARDALVGLGYAATMILFVAANKLTTSANAIFLQSTAPIYILLLAPWLLRERIRGRDLAFLAVVAAGLACFFLDEQQASSSATNPLLGNLLALGSGVGWALTVVGLRWLGARAGGEAHGSVVAVSAGNVLAFLACLAPILLADAPREPAAVAPTRTTDVLLVVYLGVFQIAVAYALVTAAMRHVEAFEASVLLLVEPVLNPVWAFLVQGERPAALSLAGGTAIVLATLVKTWSDAAEHARTVAPLESPP